MKLTFNEEVDNVIGCMEYLTERIGNANEGKLSEDDMVNEDARKCLEFLYKLKEIVRGACVLAVYGGEREIDDNFGADSYACLDKYLQGGIELCDKFGKEDFYNDYEDYFSKNIESRKEM